MLDFTAEAREWAQQDNDDPQALVDDLARRLRRAYELGRHDADAEHIEWLQAASGAWGAQS